MANCLNCGSELIDLFTSAGVCPNNCGEKVSEKHFGRLVISDVYWRYGIYGPVGYPLMLSCKNKMNDDLYFTKKDAREIADFLIANKFNTTKEIGEINFTISSLGELIINSRMKLDYPDIFLFKGPIVIYNSGDVWRIGVFIREAIG